MMESIICSIEQDQQSTAFGFAVLEVAGFGHHFRQVLNRQSCVRKTHDSDFHSKNFPN